MKRFVTVLAVIVFTASLGYARFEKGSIFFAVNNGQISNTETMLAENPELIDARYEPPTGAKGDYDWCKGRTPLHVAIEQHGQLGMTKLLLKYGARVNVQGGKNSVAPLHIGDRLNRFDKVPLLIEAGADLNIQDKWGSTALHHAVMAQSMEVLEQLVDAGADINIKSNKGLTALKFAIEYRGGREGKLARFLLQNGAIE